MNRNSLDVLFSQLCRPALRVPLASLLAATFAFVPGAQSQDDDPEPVITWQRGQPAFVRRVFFADDASGEPLRSARGPIAERFGFYVWTGRPLWLVVEIADAPEGARLCVLWSDPNGEPAAEPCEPLPAGPARLAFQGPENSRWPTGRYYARLSIEQGRNRQRERIAEIAYALGVRLPLARLPREGPPRDEIPQFPWPPPQPTTQMVLDRMLITRDAATLGEAADRLTTALGGLGYSEHSFYAVPGGFALATRLEQIEFDGTPKGEPLRWSAALPPREIFTLGDFISALFTAPEGHYRVIVFVVNDRAFAASGDAVSRDVALGWLRGGVNRLPASLAGVALTDDHAGTALIYQFRKIGQQREPIANPDGAEPALRHLERSGILSALGG